MVAEDSWRLNHARALESRILATMPHDPASTTEILKPLTILSGYSFQIHINQILLLLIIVLDSFYFFKE